MQALLNTNLRPEVARVVEREAATAALHPSDNRWDDYEAAKDAIANACDGDDGQFEMAVRAYCELAGI